MELDIRKKRDFTGRFNARVVGEVVEKGVSHIVWFTTKTRNFLDRVVSLVVSHRSSS